jgi:hypothetical protein
MRTARKDAFVATAALLLMLAVLLPFVWWISTDEQRAQYRAWLGLVNGGESIGEEETESPPQFLAIEAASPGAARPTRRSTLRHGDVSVCSPTAVANPARLPKDAVYRWTDDSGQVHFSDRPPDKGATTGAQRVALTGGTRFSATWTFDGFRPPPLLREALERNVDGVFRFFEHGMSLDGMEPLQVNLRMIKGRKRFAAYRDARDPGLTTDSGFYRFRDNEAVVRWTGEQRAIAVARHEVSHLVVGNLLGDTPTWVDEGLAEVVERLAFSDGAMLAQPDREAIEALQPRIGGPGWPSARQFMQLTRTDWDRQGETVSYQYAWSLVHFLLEDSRRRELLVDYLDTAARHRCRRVDTTAFFDSRYPGGLDRFEKDWLAWLRNARPAAVSL